ncbi:MAG TPA: M23 family metallopeptidase [Gaiellaceae bacterium]|nr:M23 family metallopeptidase [Gaiellaceae bacterium]
MSRHRTTARALLLVAILGLTAGQASALPDPGIPKRAPATPGKTVGGGDSITGKRIIFPVLGRSHYTNDFGDARGQGRHEGIDIVAPKKSLAVAAEAGKVKFWTTSARAGCMLYLYGDSGTTYLYIHLNNDLTMANDNRGRCAAGIAFAPGLKTGQRVAAGEPVGFVGDSGDANGIAAHLHFELHPHDGAAASPFTALNRGYRLLFAAPRKGQTSLWLKGSVLAQQTDALKVQVNSLAVRTTGLKVSGISRSVSFGISEFTQIENTVANVAKQRATVWTAIMPVTLDAQLGKPGAITAERVLLAGSK